MERKNTIEIKKLTVWANVEIMEARISEFENSTITIDFTQSEQQRENWLEKKWTEARGPVGQY